METGISDAVTQRAMVSVTSMKSPPASAEKGISRRLSFPKAMRPRCGIRRPTQPMTPQMETTEAVMAEAAAMTSPRTSGRFTPRARASSSGRERAFSRKRSRKSSRVPARITGPPVRSALRVMPEKLPISQKVMTGRTSCGSAAYFTRETSAENRELITMPARITMIMDGRVLPAVRVTKKTRSTEKTPNRKEESCTPAALKPRRMARAAPKEAPFATPRVSGVASGFAKKLWKAAPAQESPAPPSSAIRILGIRILKRTVRTLAAFPPAPENSAIICPGVMRNCPMPRDARAARETAARRKSMLNLYIVF